MKTLRKWKTFFAALGMAAMLGAGILIGAADFGMPTTVLHVVTVQWKSGSTPEQRTQALEGVKKMAAEIPGIKNIWLKTLKVQPGDYNAVFVMEFESTAAFDAYAADPRHRAWEKIYLPVREESRTCDVTN